MLSFLGRKMTSNKREGGLSQDQSPEEQCFLNIFPLWHSEEMITRGFLAREESQTLLLTHKPRELISAHLVATRYPTPEVELGQWSRKFSRPTEERPL